jgi:hypothetical protein
MHQTLTVDCADNADKIRDIRVICGQWIEKERRDLRAFSATLKHFHHEP